MIVFLYGKNSYSRTKKLIKVLEIYKDRLSGLEPARFDFLAGAEAAEIAAFLNSPSIFAEKRFAVIENPFESKEKKELKKIFEDNAGAKESILVVVSDENPPKSFEFLLKKPSVSQEFPEIKKGSILDAFIGSEAAKRNLKLSSDDIYHLSETFGSDLWGVSTELDRLSLMDIKVIEKHSEHDYFKTINSFKFGRTAKERLMALEILLSVRGDEAAKIFNMISFGLSDGQKIGRLADYDVAIKSGKLDYEEALTDFSL